MHKKSTSKQATAKKSKVSTKAKVAIGAGVAALGAGAYYFMGPDGKKHQKKAKVFAAKMEREVKANMKKVKGLGLPIAEEVIDAVAKKYSQEYREHSADVAALAKTLKTKWKGAKKTVKADVRKTVKLARRGGKAVKKVVRPSKK